MLLTKANGVPHVLRSYTYRVYFVKQTQIELAKVISSLSLWMDSRCAKGSKFRLQLLGVAGFLH